MGGPTADDDTYYVENLRKQHITAHCPRLRNNSPGLAKGLPLQGKKQLTPFPCFNPVQYYTTTFRRLEAVISGHSLQSDHIGDWIDSVALSLSKP